MSVRAHVVINVFKIFSQTHFRKAQCSCLHGRSIRFDPPSNYLPDRRIYNHQTNHNSWTVLCTGENQVSCIHQRSLIHSQDISIVVRRCPCIGLRFHHPGFGDVHSKT